MVNFYPADVKDFEILRIENSHDILNQYIIHGNYNYGGINLSVASMMLGVIGIFAWSLPYLGFPINIIGLVVGILQLKHHRNGMAIAGIVMCTVGLSLTIVNISIGLLSFILKTYFQ